MKTDRNRLAPHVICTHLSESVCFIFILLLFSACTSNKSIQTEPSPDKPEVVPAPTFQDGSPLIGADTYGTEGDCILLSFAGDVMAHNVNYNMKDYNLIYTDIVPLVSKSAFSFANLETPVDDDRAFSNYPCFNVKHTYPDAAISAGFNVFSLANNHTNDQSIEGINATKKYFDAKRKETASSSRPVYACGLKEKKNGPLTYQLIKSDGWTILFVAVTEILNQRSYSSYIDYIQPTNENRTIFAENLKQLREQNPCDLFILSIHSSDPEYVLTISKKQRSFYYSLLDAGVDVIWANHPHVAKDWEVIGTSEKKIPEKMIFYACGNTISGQRYSPAFTNASNPRDYTGDGFIFQVRFERRPDGIKIVWVNPVLITTYITPANNYIIKKLDDAFIAELTMKKQTKWATYLEERKNLMEKIKGKTIWR